LALNFAASSYTEAVKLKQVIDSVTVDALNTCWTTSGSSWLAMALEHAGMWPLTRFKCKACDDDWQLAGTCDVHFM
jgi:hypothetical protein